jgi:hypothetical protein
VPGSGPTTLRIEVSDRGRGRQPAAADRRQQVRARPRAGPVGRAGDPRPRGAELSGQFGSLLEVDDDGDGDGIVLE